MKLKTIRNLKQCPECGSKQLETKYGIFSKCKDCGRSYSIIRDELNIYDDKPYLHHDEYWYEYDLWKKLKKQQEQTKPEKVTFTQEWIK